jgi:hypothetical protein
MFYGHDRLNGVVGCLGDALLWLWGEMKYLDDEDGRDRRCDDGVVVVMIRREGIANILNFLVSFFPLLSLHTLFFSFSSLVFLNTRSLKLKLRCD